ncbi:carbohydrate ABC transporter permease [Rhizobium sp. P40RR-XXII]|uniref:carbohydrate ABC transporter permease n=1 Tax=Rhizobium sp. P40RR-XXII TaxID=2726739 RepID=UPI0014574035|nr:carbohydrate ABC transporter permease [Rhizobium sp. P40RR-XXII]NLS17796.1 carbohydrate ABC transporter permease [Rhizobium sp. P40RR-XXII]
MSDRITDARAGSASASHHVAAGRWTSRALTVLTALGALIWFFPLYWAIATSLKSDTEVVSKTAGLFPKAPTLEPYRYVIERSSIIQWYINSVATSAIVAALVLAMSLCCAYALSQIQFPGRRLIYGALIASVMVPTEALIINHFVLMNSFGLINTWGGIVLPQLVVPSVIIILKQFFDQIPREFREAAMLDNAGHLRTLWKIYVPMNWGVITALAITTFIAAWNNFLWPFLVATSDATITIPVGITQVKDVFGVRFAKDMAAAVLAGLPVAILYLLFQRQITRAIMLSAGIKG